MVELVEDECGPFFGEVKPRYGKWSWPLQHMKEGDWFIVDHARRKPEDVRVYVGVRGSQLHKRFIVVPKDEEHPGFCRVTCVAWQTEEEKQEHIATGFLGEVKPQYGRWRWPLGWMKPGDWFVVDHARRDPEQVRQYVSVRASQLGKRFSVIASDPERLGYSRVTCVPVVGYEEEEQSDGIELAPEKAHDKFREWYAWDLGDLPYGELFYKRKAVVMVEQVATPPVKRIIFDVPEHHLGAILHPDCIEFISLPKGAMIASWKVEAVEDIMD